jgi:hypothetical protein
MLAVQVGYMTPIKPSLEKYGTAGHPWYGQQVCVQVEARRGGHGGSALHARRTEPIARVAGPGVDVRLRPLQRMNRAVWLM